MNKYLQETKKVCHQELNRIQNKYSVSHMETILRFLKNDLQKHIIIAFIGLIPTILFASLNPQSIILCLSLYFMFLGMLFIYEQLKEHIYGMEEVLSMCYLHFGRRFIYKTICISILQLIIMVICQLLFIDQNSIDLVLATLIPVYISQIMTIFFVHKINNTFGCFVVQSLSYMSALIINQYCQNIFQITIIHCALFVVALWLILLFSVIYIQRQKGMTFIWN